MTAEEHIEALSELKRLKAEGKYIDYTNRKPSYDGETEIDERTYSDISGACCMKGKKNTNS